MGKKKPKYDKVSELSRAVWDKWRVAAYSSDDLRLRFKFHKKYISLYNKDGKYRALIENTGTGWWVGGVYGLDKAAEFDTLGQALDYVDATIKVEEVMES